MRTLRATVALPVAVVLVGCAATQETPARPSADSTSPGIASPATPAVEPSATPVVEGLGVTCGEGAAFAPNLLFEAGTAHLAEDPAAAALRAFLASAEGASSGASSWVRVEQTLRHVQFVGRQADDRWSYVRFARRDAGWKPEGRGECAVAVALEAGILPVEWTVDAATLDPLAREVVVLLDTVPCDPGGPALAYVEPPTVVAREDRVEIAVLAREDRAAEYCRGPLALSIDLPEPLGDRLIHDGAVFPPRLVTDR